MRHVGKMSTLFSAAMMLLLVCSEALAQVNQGAGEVQRGGRLGARPRAQGTTAPARERTVLRPTQGAMNADHHIAAILALGNMQEVALGNFASQQSQSEQVRSFAQQMVKDHGQMLQKLQPFAPDFVSMTGAARTGAPTTTTDAAAPTESGANIQVGATQVQVGATAAGSRMGFDPLRVMREVSERHIASAERELSQKRGAQFDKCYVGMQSVAHMHMLDKLQVFRNYASPQLQPGIDEAIQTTQAHLQHAKQLMASLDPSASGAARPASQTGNAGR